VCFREEEEEEDEEDEEGGEPGRDVISRLLGSRCLLLERSPTLRLHGVQRSGESEPESEPAGRCDSHDVTSKFCVRFLIIIL